MPVNNMIKKGEELLNSGFSNEAMAYFYNAAEESKSNNKMSEAATLYERASYCFEIEGRMPEAIKDLENANKIYLGIGDLENSKRVQNKIKSLTNEISK